MMMMMMMMVMMMMALRPQSVLFAVFYWVLALRLSNKRVTKFRVKFIWRSIYGRVGALAFNSPTFHNIWTTAWGAEDSFKSLRFADPSFSQVSATITLYFRLPSNHLNVPQLHCFGSYPSAITLSADCGQRGVHYIAGRKCRSAPQHHDADRTCGLVVYYRHFKSIFLGTLFTVADHISISWGRDVCCIRYMRTR